MNVRGVLWFSLCANIGLAAFVIKQHQTPVVAPPPLAKAATAITPVAVPVPAAVTNTLRLDWTSIESAQYKTYIANLRAARCPEETIRDIIIADVNKLYATRWKEMVKKPGEIKYWEPFDSMAEYVDRDILAKKKALESEKKALIQDLLEVDLAAEMRRYDMLWTGFDREELLLSFLPEETRKAVLASRNKSRELAQAIMERANNGKLSKEDSDELKKVRANEQAELHKLLTPQEYEQYVMRVSATANVIRSQLVGFDPTEQEYIAIFRAQAAYNNQVSAQSDSLDPDQLGQLRAQLSRQMDQQLSQTLGAQRFQDYQLTKDNTYRGMIRFAQQQGLTTQTASSIYSVQKAAMAAINQVASRPDLPPDQKQQAFQAIAAKSRTELQGLMTTEAMQAYEHSWGGWLRSPQFQPRP